MLRHLQGGQARQKERLRKSQRPPRAVAEQKCQINFCFFIASIFSPHSDFLTQNERSLFGVFFFCLCHNEQ